MSNNIKTISFYVSKSHPDYKVARTHSFEARRLYNTLNKLYCERDAKRLNGKLQTPVHNSLKLTVKDSAEKCRKVITKQQNIVLPEKISQGTRNQLQETWSSVIGLRKKGKKAGNPKYKFRFAPVRYNNQAIADRKREQGVIIPSGWKKGFRLPGFLVRKNVSSALLVPCPDGFVLRVVYEVSSCGVSSNFGNSVFAGIDFGVDKLATIVTTGGQRPKTVDGNFLKSLNRFFNKESGRLSSLISVSEGVKRESLIKQKERLWFRRDKQVNHFLQSASSEVVRFLMSSGVQEVVIGWSDGFKSGVSIGRRNNQNFVCIPHARFRDLLVYKCGLVGIKCVIQEESYTSRASFLDGDVIPVFNKSVPRRFVFSGVRVSRGVYKSKVSGDFIHADVNGAWNILRKCKPSIGWSSGVIVTPENLKIR